MDAATVLYSFCGFCFGGIQRGQGRCHMGIYLNPSAEKFQIDRNAEIYVDKSELIMFGFAFGAEHV